MTKFIAVDSNGDHITIGEEYDCRVAAANHAFRTGDAASVYETSPPDDEEEDIEEPEPLVTWTKEEVVAALDEAWDWLCVDNGDDARLTADLEDAQNKFCDARIDEDLKAAYHICQSVSFDWASGDVSGFQGLSDIYRR